MLTLMAVAVLSATAPQISSPTIGDRFHVGEEARWNFEADGKRIGHHASRYIGQDQLAGKTAHHFQGQIRLPVAQLGGAELRSSADLWTNDAGHPLRFTLHALVGDSYSRVELEFAGDKAQARIVQGASPRELSVSVDPAARLLANNFVSHIELALALTKPGDDASFPMFSGNTLQGFTYKLTAEGTFEHEHNGAKQVGNVYQDSLGERLRVVDGRLLDIEVAAQKIVIRRSDEKTEWFTITPPEVLKASAAFATEAVRIAQGDAVIAGAITKLKDKAGRLPAVFFISGSGPQDRHGFSSGIDLGTHEILDRLTSDGFLVLRVDDRGAGESSPPPADMSYLDLVADARACVEFLKRREDVDLERIALIGHSEGGETAPILATEPLSIAAIVLMAAPGRSVIAILTDQNRLALEQQGLKGDELEHKLAEVVDLLRRLCGTQAVDPAELPADQRSILSNRTWLRSHALQDPIATIQKVRCPVLILQGAKDFQVSLDRDALALEAGLKAVRHPDFELRAFEKLDHLFKVVPGEKSELADYTKSRPVAPEFLDALSGWLRGRLKVTDH